MKILTPLVLSFSLACASGDGFVNEGVKQCSPGDPIAINVGFEPAGSPGRDNADDRLTLLVEVANNSDEEVVVQTIRVDPQTPMSNEQAYELTSAGISPRQPIAEADAFIFRVPMSVRRTSDYVPYSFSGVVDLAVSVALEDGTRYRCRFRASR